MSDVHQDRRSRTESSPRSLARRIEGCIARNALDEEQRAQKALFLLKARDRRIAFLERRVAELEDTAASLHELSLRASETSEIHEDAKPKDGVATLDTPGQDTFGDRDCTSEPSVPRLGLSKSASTSEKDLFSTAVDLTSEIEFICDGKYCRENETNRDDTNQKVKTDRTCRKIDDTSCASCLSVGAGDRRIHVILHARQRSSFPRISSSVPWIRPRRNLRRKSRGGDTKTERQHRDDRSAADIGRCEGPYPFFHSAGIEASDRAGRGIIETGNVENTVDVQGARAIAVEKIGAETQTISTQTSPQSDTNLPNFDRKVENNSVPSCVCLGQKKSSTFWSVDDDPAPQWLIEEALGRGTEVCKVESWRNREETNKENDYETIISELRMRLDHAKADLDDALRTKSIVKEKYKRTLETVKAEAHRDNEMLQERIVRICTSVLENFGPRAMCERRRGNYTSKCHRRLRCHEKASSKLHKKLRVAVAKTKKLSRELLATRRALKDKSDKHDSMNKCFGRLKQEMETTEINLNNLIAENMSLRKKIEDTREWMELRIGKEQHEKSNSAQFRDMQRSRELTNLKKKAEEDFATITQLRNKLLRSESANANKGFLLNSYKSQLNDLSKERDQLVTKISGLENEINAIRNNNAQLKAKISVLSIEKDDKSRASENDKMEPQGATKCDDSTQQEIDAVKNKYEEIIKCMNAKMNTVENQSAEYSRAIKDLLEKVHNFHESQKIEKNPSGSERDAHETACNILNMTPEELSGFMKGETPNSINSWLTELTRITSKTNFSESLTKFLWKKTVKKVKS